MPGPLERAAAVTETLNPHQYTIHATQPVSSRVGVGYLDEEDSLCIVLTLDNQSFVLPPSVAADLASAITRTVSILPALRDKLDAEKKKG